MTWDDSFLLFGFAHVGRTCNYNYSYAFVLLYVHLKTNHIMKYRKLRITEKNFLLALERSDFCATGVTAKVAQPNRI